MYEAAREFWDLHRETQTSESWPPGNTYVNHWVADSTMCSFEDRRLQPLGFKTKDIIWDQARPILEAWTGQKLKPTSLYGIRSYFRGAILATHVDRLPLVTSAIINVDQDVEEDWPIEVVGHDGVAYNVTLKPGDMALYESHTVLHGRPFPLKGNFYANLFVHFIPVDPDERDKYISEEASKFIYDFEKDTPPDSEELMSLFESSLVRFKRKQAELNFYEDMYLLFDLPCKNFASVNLLDSSLSIIEDFGGKSKYHRFQLDPRLVQHRAHSENIQCYLLCDYSVNW